MIINNSRIDIDKTHNPNFAYRADVDGLRALAIILVVLFHCFSDILKAGFVGVDIFFVISGYLISSIILKNLQAGNFSFREFYWRRIKRIFPVLALVLVASLIFGWVFLYAGEYQELAIQAASGAGFVANFELLRESGYFDADANTKPLLHLWSLGIEEQFYIVWPLLLWFSFKRKYNFLAVIIFIAVLSFIFNIVIVENHPIAAFYLPICRFWEIMIGGILAYLELNFSHQLIKNKIQNYQKKAFSIKGLVARMLLVVVDKVISKSGNWRSNVGVVLIILSLVLVNRDQQFPGYLALLPCVGAFLIIAGGRGSWVNRKILANKLMVYIGLISYPLYLWHWPLLSFATIIKGRPPEPEVLLLVVVLSILLAFLSYQFIEKPIRQSVRNKGKADARNAVILVGGMLAIFIFSVVVVVFSGFEGRISSSKSLLIRSMNRGQSIDRNCLEKYQDLTGLDYCRISGEGGKKIFVIGDSHSQAIFEGYSPVLTSEGYQVIHLAKSGCPFVIFGATHKRGRVAMDECSTTFRHIIDVAVASKPAAILFTNNAWRYYQSEFATSMDETVKMIPKSIPLIYFLQFPKLPFLPASCVSRANNDNFNSASCAFERKIYNQELVNYLPVVANLAKNHPNVVIIDSASAICNATLCFAMNESSFIYYRDGAHLSINGGELIAKFFPLKNYLNQNN